MTNTNHMGERYPHSAVRFEADLELMRQGKNLILMLDRPGDKLHHLGRAMSGGLFAGELTILAGPPGNGKSYLSLMLGVIAHREKVRWVYQPIEDEQSDWYRRGCAVHYDNWHWLGKNRSDVAFIEDKQNADIEWLNGFGANICDNPARAYYDDSGDVVVPDVDYGQVTEWLGNGIKDERLIVIDPISMLEFNNGRQQSFEGQSKLVKKSAGIAKLKRLHVILVCHTEKRPGSVRRLGMSDVQGAADLTRFAQNVLLMDYHDPRESRVLTSGNKEDKVTHERTLIVAKSREGAMSHARIALDFSDTGPAFVEHGYILEDE